MDVPALVWQAARRRYSRACASDLTSASVWPNSLAWTWDEPRRAVGGRLSQPERDQPVEAAVDIVIPGDRVVLDYVIDLD